jgi:hypothetical protein
MPETQLSPGVTVVTDADGEVVAVKQHPMVQVMNIVCCPCNCVLGIVLACTLPCCICCCAVCPCCAPCKEKFESWAERRANKMSRATSPGAPVCDEIAR